MSSALAPCPGWAEYTEETARLTVARRNKRDGVWVMSWCNGHWHVYTGQNI